MPIEGRSPSEREKTSIIISASQYEGVDMAKREMTMMTPSQMRL
jgi:hypothetical protein